MIEQAYCKCLYFPLNKSTEQLTIVGDSTWFVTGGCAFHEIARARQKLKKDYKPQLIGIYEESQKNGIYLIRGGNVILYNFEEASPMMNAVNIATFHKTPKGLQNLARLLELPDPKIDLNLRKLRMMSKEDLEKLCVHPTGI